MCHVILILIHFFPAILKPTALPPTVDLKPVPPQAIPPPHGQPPFLLEELNSLNDGPLEEHPVPETSFDPVPLDDHHGHKVFDHHEDDHHFPDIFDEHFDDGHHDAHHSHDSSHLAINPSPAVVIHLGDRTKEKKNDKKKDDGKRKKHPPTNFKQDDRYVTHLVAAAPVSGKSVDEDKKPAEEKKPPLEKPTAKQDKPKQGIPTAQLLMQLQNPKDLRLDDNRVYTDSTGLYAPGALNQISANAHGGTPYGAQVYARPAVKHVVEKGDKSKLKKVQSNKQPVKPNAKLKQAQKPRVIWAGYKQQQKPIAPVSKSKAFSKKPSIVCPGFCEQVCDRWCVNIGCCKKLEISGPTVADSILPARVKNAIDKKGKIVAETR